MKVNLVGPDNILPGGSLIVSLHGVPRIGEVVHLRERDTKLVVTDVWWPCGHGVEIHPDVTVETLQ